jgi:hypothetical protein
MQHSKAKLRRLVSFNLFLSSTADINATHKSLSFILYLISRLQKKTNIWMGSPNLFSNLTLYINLPHERVIYTEVLTVKINFYVQFWTI